MGQFIDITSMRFGRLTAVNRTDYANKQGAMWRCICDCGKECVVRSAALRSLKAQSCGCRAVDIRRAACTKHGKSDAAVYKVWDAVRQRCNNPKSANFHQYGARGITICDRWLAFENFLADMGEPGPGLSIERIDNDKGYEPANCRWATTQEQNRNTRRNVNITHNGSTKCLQDWAKEYGLSPCVLSFRLRKGWDTRTALETKPTSANRIINLRKRHESHSQL